MESMNVSEWFLDRLFLTVSDGEVDRKVGRGIMEERIAQVYHYRFPSHIIANQTLSSRQFWL